MEVVLLAREMDLVAGLDFLAGAGTKQNQGKTTRDISGGTLHLKSIRAGMTSEGEAGPGEDGAEASSPKLLVASQRRNLFIFLS